MPIIFAIDIDLNTVPIRMQYPIGDVRNDIERANRMSFSTMDVDQIPAPHTLFQCRSPMNGRTFMCLAVHKEGVPPDHDAIVVYQLHR